MRVIAGSHRGRKLQGPPESVLRPTSDRVREALGSILNQRLPGSRFLDLYAGTGAVGIEALSRGASHVTYVEMNPQALAILRRNITACQLTTQTTIYANSVRHFLQRPEAWGEPFDILFADPPYDMAHELPGVLMDITDRLLAPHACVVIEHGRKTVLPTGLGGCALLRRYDYGDTALSLFSNTGPVAS